MDANVESKTPLWKVCLNRKNWSGPSSEHAFVISQKTYIPKPSFEERSEETRQGHFRRQLQDHHPQVSVDGLPFHVPGATGSREIA